MSNVNVKQQSVIVNYNPSFMNGKAFDFKQNFNRELVIDKNAEVMLYNASLTRKPIVLPYDTRVSVVIDNSLPFISTQATGDEHILGGAVEFRIDNLNYLNIQATIPKGTYTRQSFLQKLSAEVNNTLYEKNQIEDDNINYLAYLQSNGFDRVEKVLNNLNYRFAIVDDENGLFYGLTLDTSIVSQGTFRPNESLCQRRMTVDHGEDAPIGGADPTAASGHNMALESSLQKMTTQTSKATGNDTITPSGAVADATKFEYYALADSPLLPVSGNRQPIKNFDTTNICNFEWSFDLENVDTDTPKRGARDTYACCVMTNDYMFAMHNPIAPSVELATAQVNPNLNGDNGDMPVGFFGVYERLKTNAQDEILNSEVVLFENEFIQSANASAYRDDAGGEYPQYIMNENARYERKLIFQNRDGNTIEYTAFKFVIYSVDTGDFKDENRTLMSDGKGMGTKKYFYQLHGLASGFGEGEWKVLYDQRNTDSYIPAQIVEDGSLAKMVDNPRSNANYEEGRLDVGLKPLLAMKNPVIPTSNDPQDGDFFFNPCGTFALAIDYHAPNYAGGVGAQAKDIFLNRTIQTYGFQSQGVLRNVLGVDYLDPVFLDSDGRTPISPAGLTSSSTKKVKPIDNHKNPNIFQSERGFFAGYTSVYSDLNSYNIEIQSLPIKTYNTTSRELDYTTKPFINPAGALRPVVFHIPTLIDGETTDINSVYLNKEVKPSIPKSISLNNAERIKLNTLEVKIVRAKTNEDAEEIVDCNLELIIKNNT